MTNAKPTRRINPTILACARELRREMTPQERKLWGRLRNRQLFGLIFHRRKPGQACLAIT
jgi:very-short-patch-repair endonuclease